MSPNPDIESKGHFLAQGNMEIDWAIYMSILIHVSSVPLSSISCIYMIVCTDSCSSEIIIGNCLFSDV